MRKATFMNSKKFKYQDYISKLFNCPPDVYKEKEMTAFRWVFSECDINSFKPVLIIDPVRQLGDEDKNCEGFALSMFEQEDCAYQKYKKLVRNRPHLKNIFGTMIAEMKISLNDGVCSNPEINNYLHLNFHEYEETDLLKKIVNIVEIFDENGNFKR